MGQTELRLCLPVARRVPVPVAVGLVLPRDRSTGCRSRVGEAGVALPLAGRAARRVPAAHAALGKEVPRRGAAPVLDRAGRPLLYGDRAAAGSSAGGVARISGDQ